MATENTFQVQQTGKRTHDCSELTMSEYVAQQLSVSYGQTAENHYAYNMT